MDRQTVDRSIIDAAPNAGAISVECVWEGPTRLGECPLWDPRENRLLLIDSDDARIWRLGSNGADARFWEVPETIGSIGLCDDGRLIAGMANGFALIDISGREARLERIGDPEPGLRTRLNDGKVDPVGRFWCGSMCLDFKRKDAALYRLDPDLTWHRMDGGFTVSNGIAFSRDGAALYFSNSRMDESIRYDLDMRSGKIRSRRPFVETSSYAGRIDGATVDEAGDYWGALFDGGAVARFSPEGALLQLVRLPVSCPTMCAFGGPDMATLYVTSATFSMTKEQLSQEPMAGGLFAIRGLDARGVPEPRFAVAGP